MTTASARSAAPAAVRWGRGLHAFELHTNDIPLRLRAATVLGAWTPAPPPVRTIAWTVAAGDGHWTLDRAGRATEVVRGDCDRVVSVLEFRGVQAILEEPPDVLTLHAALVSRADRGLLILGPGQSGKSTLACALWRHGFDFLGDDLAIVDPESGLGSAAPRRVSLRMPSRALLGESLWSRILASPSYAPTPEGCVFHPHEVEPQPRRASTRLAGCVFLSRRPGRPVDGGVSAVPPGDAVLALVPYSNLIQRLAPDVVVGRFAPLSATVPMFDLARGPLPEMIAHVDRLMGSER